MDVFILEAITPALAKEVVKQVHGTPKDEAITAHIMTLGGDMLSGNAIAHSLKASPNHVTTNVIGVAASMGAVISQVGDERLIADDAVFNVHAGAGSTPGRGTVKDHEKSIEMLTQLDANMVKAFSKTGLSNDSLRKLMDKDILLTADQSIQLGFFDKKSDPIKAVAELNLKDKDMSVISQLMAQADTAAIRLGLRKTDDPEKQKLVDELTKDIEAKAEQEFEEVVEEAAEPDTGADILTAQMISREEFEMFKAEVLALLEPLLGTVEKLPTPEETATVTEEVTTAKVDALLKDIKSRVKPPTAVQHFEQPEVVEKEDWSVYEARKKAIADKNKR